VVAGSRVVGGFPKGGKREGEMVVVGYPSRPGGVDDVLAGTDWAADGIAPEK